MWAPVITSHDYHPDLLKRRNVVPFVIMRETKMAVIMPLHRISLVNKLIRGVIRSEQTILVSVLLMIGFGLLMSIVERFDKRQCDQGFFRRPGIGIWLSCVTLTTVGYGDVVPKTFLGRFIAVHLMFIGLISTCVITATINEVVSGTSDLDIYGEHIAVLRNSYEAKAAHEQHNASLLEVESYEDVLEQVKTGTVYAGLMNLNVASWYHDLLQNGSLRIIYTIPVNINIELLAHIPSANGSVKKIWDCAIGKFYYQVFYEPERSFKKHPKIESLYNGLITDLILKHTFGQVLFGTVLGMIVVGVFFQIYFVIKNPGMKERNGDGLNNVIKTEINVLKKICI